MGPSQTLCVALKLSVASIGHFKRPVASVGHYWSFFNPKQPHKAPLQLTSNVYPLILTSNSQEDTLLLYTGIIVPQIAEQN